MTTVQVSFTPLPAHVRTARLIAVAVARRSGVDESLLDEVRLAVGEACSRAVEAHREQYPGEPVRVAFDSHDGRFEIEVANAGLVAPSGSGPASDPVAGAAAAPGFSLAVIAGLADDVRISESPAGTRVTMSWPLSGSLAAGSPA